jgi:hypothetical protein
MVDYEQQQLKVMPFEPPRALSVDMSEGSDRKRDKNPAQREGIKKTQI